MDLIKVQDFYQNVRSKTVIWTRQLFGTLEYPSLVFDPFEPKRHTLNTYQGMHKNMVKNDRKIFEIPALLSSQQENPNGGKFKIIYIFLIFPALQHSGFPRSQLAR